MSNWNLLSRVLLQLSVSFLSDRDCEIVFALKRCCKQWRIASESLNLERFMKSLFMSSFKTESSAENEQVAGEKNRDWQCSEAWSPRIARRLQIEHELFASPSLPPQLREFLVIAQLHESEQAGPELLAVEVGRKRHLDTVKVRVRSRRVVITELIADAACLVRAAGHADASISAEKEPLVYYNDAAAAFDFGAKATQAGATPPEIGRAHV